MLRKLGFALLAATAILFSAGSTGCKSEKAPAIDVCLGDGFGGASCVLREGSELRSKCHYSETVNAKGWYCPPSSLENMWMTTQRDMESFSSFCYDVSRKTARNHMRAYSQALR